MDRAAVFVDAGYLFDAGSKLLSGEKLARGDVHLDYDKIVVDSLVVTDLINLARNRAMADALLMTGDEDIRVGVQQAQEFGVRVHLIGLEPARENQSGFLVQEADNVRELSLAEVREFLSCGQPAEARGPSSHPSDEPPQSVSTTLEAIARKLALELNAEEKRAVLAESVGGSVPSQVDRRLLVAGMGATNGAVLTPDQKRRLRKAFLEACR